MYKMKLQHLAVIVFIGLVGADTTADVQNSLQNLNIEGLPDLTNITDKFKPEDAEKLLQDKCKKNSADSAAYDNAKKAAERAQECVKAIVDPEKVQEEIEKAKPTGDLDVVFKKYCQQSPALKKCIFDLTSAYEPCLEAEEIETKNTAINVTDSLVDFICFKDGDRIALFIAEGGPQCLNSSSAAIKGCIEKTFSQKIEGDMPTIDSLPLLLLKTEECEKFTVLQKCIVNEMEKCNETTPANVMDSLFNFVRRHTPCIHFKPTSLGSSGSNGGHVLHAVISTTIVSALLLLKLT